MIGLPAAARAAMRAKGRRDGQRWLDGTSPKPPHSTVDGHVWARQAAVEWHAGFREVAKTVPQPKG